MTCERRLGRILGLPCVCGEKVVGHVERAVPDETGQQVQGFIIRRGLGSAKWADRRDISLVGDVSVILQRKPVRMPRYRQASMGVMREISLLPH